MSDTKQAQAAAGSEKGITIETRMKSSILRALDFCVQELSKLVEDRLSFPKGTQFCALFKEFTNVIKTKLLFSPRLEYLYASQLKAVQTRTNTGDIINNLESKLEEAQKTRDKELNLREEILLNIETKIKAIENESYDLVVDIRTKTMEELQQLEEESKIVQEKLNEEYNKSEEFIQEMENGHLQMELDLRNRRKSIENEIMAIIENYDKTMEDFVNQKEDLLKQLENIANISSSRQEYCNTLEKRYNEIEEERAEEERIRMAAIQEEFHREHSARIIQRAWQHYKMKKMLKKAQKKGKKKKGTAKETKKK